MGPRGCHDTLGGKAAGGHPPKVGRDLPLVLAGGHAAPGKELIHLCWSHGRFDHEGRDLAGHRCRRAVGASPVGRGGPDGRCPAAQRAADPHRRPAMGYDRGAWQFANQNAQHGPARRGRVHLHQCLLHGIDGGCGLPAEPHHAGHRPLALADTGQPPGKGGAAGRAPPARRDEPGRLRNVPLR